MIMIDGVTVAFILTFLLFLPVIRELMIMLAYLTIQAIGGLWDLLFEAPVIVNLATIAALVFIVGAVLIRSGWITT